jgi:hypothetical protein
MANTIKKSKSAVAGKKISAKNTTAEKPFAGAKISVRKTSKVNTGDSLTRKILKEAASVGFSKAADKTMKVMGYNVIVKNGWVVKKFADGRIQKISKLKTNNNPVILD